MQPEINSWIRPSLVYVVVEAADLEPADLDVERERVERHGADERDARRHSIHDLKVSEADRRERDYRISADEEDSNNRIHIIFPMLQTYPNVIRLCQKLVPWPWAMADATWY